MKKLYVHINLTNNMNHFVSAIIFSNKHSFLSRERFEAFYARGKKEHVSVSTWQEIIRNLQKIVEAGRRDIDDNDPTGRPDEHRVSDVLSWFM